MKRTKSPGERLPVGVLSWGPVVSSCVSCWRRETVALHALEASLHNVDLHRLPSSSSGSPYRAAALLRWSDRDTVAPLLVSTYRTLLRVCRFHFLRHLLLGYDITSPSDMSTHTICTKIKYMSPLIFVYFSGIALLYEWTYTIAITRAAAQTTATAADRRQKVRIICQPITSATSNRRKPSSQPMSVAAHATLARSTCRRVGDAPTSTTAP